MNAIWEQINSAGLIFVEFALPMFVQSGVLILILLLADFALRKKVRAVFRYGIWLLVLIKLVLPTSLSAPLSLGYFFGNQLAYVDGTETTTETAQTAPAIVSPMIDSPRAEAGSDTSAIATTTPTIEPAVTEPVNTQVVSVTPLSWQGAVFLAWLTVVLTMGLLLLQRAIFVRGLVAQAKEANDSMADTLESCRERMGVKRKIGLKVSANAASPAVCGLFRPVILVPQNLTSSLSPSQLRAVLLHELAHIKRVDLWVNLAQTVLQIIYFYNLLLWLANCVIRRVREQAVDEMVLVAMGKEAQQYPQTLVNVAKLAFKRPALSLRLIGVVESKSALAGRIKHILNRPMPKKTKLGILGLTIVIIIAAILLPMAKSMPGPPELIIKGVVKDAQTGEPIAGARVFDDGYGPEPNWEQIKADERSEWGAITNSTGEYSFLTWPEHHTIKVEAPGYKAKRQSLYDGHFTFNKKDEETFDFALEPEKASEPSEFNTKLPNGVTVELVGVCEHPSEGKQWWRPDGSILETDHAPSDHSRMTVKPDETEQARELALRFAGQDVEHISFTWEIDMSTRSSSHPFYVTEKREKLKPLRNIVFKLPQNLETLDFSIGVATGEWKRVASGGDGRTVSGTNDSLTDSSVIFHEAVKENDTVRLCATHLLGRDYDCRIMVVDRDDEIHEPIRSSNSGSDMRLCKGFFDLSPEQIEYILLQARPYEWITFKNVSLRPEYKTDVQVEVKGEPPESEVPEEMVGTWFFDNPGGDDEQMTIFPDGRVVVLYSNGHKDQTKYINGFIELAEHDGAECKMDVEEKGTLVQYFDSGGSVLIGKRWKRIDPQPRTDLLRPLTGPDSSKTDVQVEIEPEKPAGQVQGEGGAPKQLSSGGGYQNLSREQRERLERRQANRKSPSYKNMQKLGLAVAVFANDHKGRCPSNLSDLRKYMADEQIFDWINRNVVYLGKNQQYGAPPDAVLAYDESMLKKPPQETNVLYNDAHVSFEKSEWLQEQGIILEQKPAGVGLNEKSINSDSKVKVGGIVQVEDKKEQSSSVGRKVTDIDLPFTFTIYTLTPDDKPQPGVKIRCVHPRPERAEPIVDMVVESDENGVATFTVTKADLLTDWIYWFSLADENYVGTPEVGITPDEENWTFKVLPAEEFELQVISDKRPVPDAKIYLHVDYNKGEEQDPKRFWAFKNIRSDSTGRARIKFVKGKIYMAIAAKGYASKSIRGVQLSSDKPYLIELNRGREIKGRVVDANNNPLAPVTVSAKSQGTFPWEEEFILKASTDENGKFTLKDASPGQWEVSARSEDPAKPYFIAPVTMKVRKWWPVRTIRMVAKEGFRLKGKYITNYKINLKNDGGLPWIWGWVSRPSRAWLQLRTKEDGTFDIWGFPCEGEGSIEFVGMGGYHNFIKMPEEYSYFKIFGNRLNFEDVPPGTYENVEVHYLLAGQVSGTVVDAEGHPFPGAEVDVRPRGGIHKTDKEGNFSIRVPPVDNMTLAVRDLTTRAVVFRSEPFNVKEGEVIEKNIKTRYERGN